MTPPEMPKHRLGFAAMTKEAQVLIASMGGNAVVKKRGKAFMREIGAIGGATRHKNYLALLKQRCERHEP